MAHSKRNPSEKSQLRIKLRKERILTMKIAVVTGASSGMGCDFAKGIDAEETLDEIWLIARRRERLEELAGSLRAKARIIPLDLFNPASFEEYAALLEKEKPLVSTLCNAAGFGRFALFDEVDLDTNLRMIDLNDKATVAMTQLTLPYMKRGSRVLNLDSLSAFQPVPYECIYAATKAFILSFSRALNVELEPRGIRVMAISPGWVKTEFFDHAVSDNGAVTYYDKLWEPDQVVERALRDYKKGKDVSVLGSSVRRQVFLVKMLPHKLVMKVWMKQQGHDKRPRED